MEILSASLVGLAPRRRRRRRARARCVFAAAARPPCPPSATCCASAWSTSRRRVSEDAQTAAVLAPLRDALGRVERQVGDAGARPGRAVRRSSASASATSPSTTDALRAQTASLAGSLNSSTVRGTWGEVQLRRVLEHAGHAGPVRLRRAGRAGQPPRARRPPRRRGAAARRQVPRRRRQGADDGVPRRAGRRDRRRAERDRLLADARHVAARRTSTRWPPRPTGRRSTTTPEMVVCFVPGDAILAAALSADPGLHEHAMARRVVLASPGTLLALLRTVAFTWQQDALTGNARELLELGRDALRTGSARSGAHATKMGALAAAVGRGLQRAGRRAGVAGCWSPRAGCTTSALVERRSPRCQPLEQAPRPLTAAELLEASTPTSPGRSCASTEARRDAPVRSSGTGLSRHRARGAGTGQCDPSGSVQRLRSERPASWRTLVASTPVRALRSRRSSLGRENSRLSSADDDRLHVVVAALGQAGQHVAHQHLGHAGAAGHARPC